MAVAFQFQVIVDILQCRIHRHSIEPEGLPVPPTNTDSSVFIRILLGRYGYTETMLYYMEERAS